jgi:Transposase
MAHIRIPFGNLSNNPRYEKQLTPYERGYIIKRHSATTNPATVAAYYSIPRQTVESTIKVSPYYIQGANLPKSGRLKVYTDRDYCSLLRHIRLCPKDTYDQVRTATGYSFKNNTIRRYLSLHGIANWRTKRRPHLTEAVAAARLAWCLRHRYITYKE